MSSPAVSPGPARSRVPRLAGAAVERARLTVVPRTRAVRAARVPFVILVSVVMLGGVVGLLMFNTSMQQASFTATTLEERATNLRVREETLRAELEVLRDPQKLGILARRQGMRTPVAPAFLHPDGSVSGVPLPTPQFDGERIVEPVEPLPKVLDPDPVVVHAEPPPEGTLPPSDAAAQDSSPDTAAASADGGAARDRTDRLRRQRR